MEETPRPGIAGSLRGTAGDHGWVGRGKTRAARVEGTLLLRFHGLSTRGGKLQTPIADFFRKDYRKLRPSYERFAVSIWIELGPATPKLDVDNVAKACLDALTGAVWVDDAQVVRLEVVKTPGERGTITLAIRPGVHPDTAGLEALLRRADALPAP
jgi:hypothetical protein